MKYFFRYLCAFCLSRWLWNSFRGHGHQHGPVSAQQCPAHKSGMALFCLGVVMSPFIGAAVLILIGFLQR